MHKVYIFQLLFSFLSVYWNLKFGYTKTLPINLTLTAEWSLSSKQTIHITHYIPIHICSTALHLDTANNLIGSINCADIYKSRSNRMDCNGNPLNHQNTTRLHTYALLGRFIKSLPRMLLLNVDYWRKFIPCQIHQHISHSKITTCLSF